MLVGRPPFTGSVQEICKNVENVKYQIPDSISESKFILFYFFLN